MGKKWLLIGAAAMLAGICGCKGGNEGSKTTAAASSGPEAGEETKEETKEETGTDKVQDLWDVDEGTDGMESGKETEDDREEVQPGEEAEEEQNDFRTGTWDGLTFTNSWLNLVITFPEGTRVFSEEDMRKLVGQSDEILVNSGNDEDIQAKASEALNIYDFMVTMPDGRSSVQLAYMNAEKVASGQQISAADCLEELAGELSAIGDMGYEVSGMEKAEIGGRMFDKFSANLMGGALYQEYYGIRVGDYVAMMTVSYEEAEKSQVDQMIQGIRAVR